jgi:hypothetical protein
VVVELAVVATAKPVFRFVGGSSSSKTPVRTPSLQEEAHDENGGRHGYSRVRRRLRLLLAVFHGTSHLSPGTVKGRSGTWSSVGHGGSPPQGETGDWHRR